MPADRRVDAHGRLGVTLRLGERGVQLFAHAVQPLEFELGPGLRPLLDRGDRVGVVRGERAVDPLGRGQQHIGAGHEGNVGRNLAGENGEIVQPGDLRHLDLGILVGTLDQPDHELAVVLFGKVDQPAAQRHAALLVSLHGHAEAFPARSVGPEEQ